jgi:hypothetical protein
MNSTLPRLLLGCWLLVFTPALNVDAAPSSGATSNHCDEQYKQCTARCKKMRVRRARAVCYSACMAMYAACLASSRK